MHRFVWPLRYALPESLRGGESPGATGCGRPPGRYTVELTVDGSRYAEPLILEPDPRVSLPPEAYAEQYALARAIETARVQAVVASAEMAALQKTLGERRRSAGEPMVRAIDALRARVAGLSGVPESANPGDAWFLPPKTTTSLHYLLGVLEKLEEAVDGADHAPTPDARTGFAQASKALRTTLAAWEKLKAESGPWS